MPMSTPPRTCTRLAGRLLPALFVALAASSAAAQTVGISGPTPTVTEGTSYGQAELIVLSFPPGSYSNVLLDITVPPYTSLGGVNTISTSGTWALVTPGIAGHLRFKPANGMLVNSTAASATYTIKLESVTVPARSTPSGTPVTWTATLTGNDAATPFAPATSTHSLTYVGTAVHQWGLSSAAPGVSFAGTSVDDQGNAGFLWNYHFASGNTGSAPLSGANASIVMPVGLKVVSVTNSGGPAPVTASAPSPWSYTTATPITTTTTGLNATNGLSVVVFVKCGSTFPLAGASATIVANAQTTDYAGAVTPLNQLTTTITPAAALRPVCGTAGQSKKQGNIGNFGQLAEWDLSVTPPTGIAHFDNVMLVDKLPPGATSWTLPASSAGFEVWLCAYGATQPGFFPAATFLATRATSCHQRLSAADDGWIVGASHVVWYRATWAAAAGAAMGNMSATVRLVLPTNWSAQNGDATVVSNTISWQADAPDPNTPGNVLHFGDADIATAGNADRFQWTSALGFPAPTLNARWGGSGSPTSSTANSNGGTLSLNANQITSGAYALNPTITVDVPDGLIVSGLAATYASGCTAPVPAPILPAPTDRPLVLQIGSAQDPWVETCAAVGLALTVKLDPNFPFVHRAPTPLVVRTAASNSTATPAATFTIYPLVAAGADVQTTASCWSQDDAPPAPQAGMGRFHVTAVNRGQQDLTNVVVRFAVPAGAVVVGAELGATTAAGEVFEASTNGGGAWAAIDANTTWSSVTDVRIRGFSIPGLGVDAPRPDFWVDVRPALGAASPLVGDTFMSVSELGNLPVKATAWAFSACGDSAIVLHPFLDVNADGVRQPTEPDLTAAMTFALAQGATTIAGPGAVGQGPVTFANLGAGSYDVVAVASGGGLGTWAMTTATSLALAAGATLDADVGFSCGCEAPIPGNACVVAVCDAALVCGESDAADGTACTVATPDLCAAGYACAAGQCLVAEELACDDLDFCTVDDCDGGACSHVQPPCSSTVTTFYAPVQDAAGHVVGAIACDIDGTSVTCHLDGNGLAIVYPDRGGTCDAGASDPPPPAAKPDAP